MGERRRAALAAVIIVVVLAAVLYSFCFNLLSPTPELVLADPDAAQSESPGAEQSAQAGGVAVEVTPQTVQDLVEYLERYESYRQTVTAEYFFQGEPAGTATGQVWADGGWQRTDLTLSSGAVEHAIVGEGTLWLWQDQSQGVYSGPAEERTADLSQRLPTYEDVLLLDQRDITAAGYEEREGQPCVYVEAVTELGYRERYWISVDSGLLAAAETEKDGQVVYAMTSRDVVSPLDELQGIFTLPDGTVLHAG